MRLNWRVAEREHRTALEQFVCTDPERRQYDKHRGKWHPSPWEIEVQSHLRGRRPPVASDERLLLGFDLTGIAAAVHFGFDTEGEHFIIFAAARARRCNGLGYAREGLQAAVGVCQLTKDEHGLDSAVFARADPRNTPSRKMLADVGFEYLSTADGGYETWIRDLN